MRPPLPVVIDIVFETQLEVQSLTSLGVTHPLTSRLRSRNTLRTQRKIGNVFMALPQAY